MDNYRESTRYKELLLLKPDVNIRYNDESGTWFWSVEISGSDEWIDSFDTQEEAEEFCRQDDLMVLSIK